MVQKTERRKQELRSFSPVSPSREGQTVIAAKLGPQEGRMWCRHSAVLIDERQVEPVGTTRPTPPVEETGMIWGVAIRFPVPPMDRREPGTRIDSVSRTRKDRERITD